MNKTALLFFIAAALAASGCIFAPMDLNLFKDYTDPLQEFTLSGDGDDKIVIIPVTGTITDQPGTGLAGYEPSMVQEVVSHLKRAESDSDVKAVVLTIDSPGGSVTASDILYREIRLFKLKTGACVVAAMMDTAASGGYYISMAADKIVAHPTTITGSIGVIFQQIDLTGLMELVGVNVKPAKSGSLKDMGSPFRPSTAEEDRVFQEMVDEFYGRFVSIVATGRGIEEERVKTSADGRVYTAEQALDIGLIDKIGYLDQAIDEACAIAGLDLDARTVVYRRTAYPDDNTYNRMSGLGGQRIPKLIDLGLDRFLVPPRTGFYYLWLPRAKDS